MELTGDTVIAADRGRVWAALNDPAVLARCIDGIESLVATTAADGSTRLDGTLNAGTGPVRAIFAGGVALTDVDPPHRYVLIGEGTGDVADFARGRAEIVLTEAMIGDQPGTQLRYVVTSSVGGTLAHLDARRLEGTARGYADTFFTRLKAEVETPAAAPAPAVLDAPSPSSATASSTAAEMSSPPAASSSIADDAQQLHGSRTATGLTPLIWASVVVLLVLAVLVWQLR